MAATRRQGRTRPSTTTQKSSGKPTEKPQSDSQASEKESDETSTQEKEETSSSSSSDDENEALFAEADEQAANDAESDAENDDEADDAEEETPLVTLSDDPDEDPKVVPEGEVVSFEVDHPYEGKYSFQGVVTGNTIVVTEDVSREIQLPGTKRKGTVLAHHKGQLLPLASFEHFAVKED